MTYKLNLGCGNNRLDGYINVDSDPSLKPDLVADVCSHYNFPDDSCDKILLLHCIEHIEERYHPTLLIELRRLLSKEGELVIAYPEFSKCAQNWLDNRHGKREFYKWTIYGRQSSKGDFHVSLMHTPDFTRLLETVGFRDIVTRPENTENEFYTVLTCKKGEPLPSYEEILREEVFHG